MGDVFVPNTSLSFPTFYNKYMWYIFKTGKKMRICNWRSAHRRPDLKQFRATLPESYLLVSLAGAPGCLEAKAGPPA